MKENTTKNSGNKASSHSSLLKQTKSFDMTQFSVNRLERILTKLQAVEEDSLNRLLRASEAQQILVDSHQQRQHRQVDEFKECLNVLAADVKVGLFGIKEDIKTCLNDRDKINNQVIAETMQMSA